MTSQLDSSDRNTALDLQSVGHNYGKFRALEDITLSLPFGSITALVGPNGAGKTTLLNLITGLLRCSEGEIAVCGESPSNASDFLSRIGFVGQDCPLYKDFKVGELLRLGESLNPSWNEELAMERLSGANVPLNRKAGKLSGGQRAQVALTLAVAKNPKLLILDEPLASLDPLARREFLQSLVDVVANTGMTVILSSHLIGELARICDHLIVVRDGHLSIFGEIEELISEHIWVSGSLDDLNKLPKEVQSIATTNYERHSRTLVRTQGQFLNPSLTQSPVDLEDLVLAYLESRRAEGRASHPLQVVT